LLHLHPLSTIERDHGERHDLSPIRRNIGK
jgi:hypothetical protein